MIIVTGGAGFIGSNLVAALEGPGHRVAVADWLGTTGKWRNLAKRELAAIIDPAELPPFLDAHAKEIQAIVHLGAISTTTEPDADLIVRTNFTLSQLLWRWCADHGVRFIYASSAATYGDGHAGFEDEASPGYLARLTPLNAYGWSKHLFDRWAVRQVEAGITAPPQMAGLKFFNVYGPNEYHKGSQRSVAHQVFLAAQAGEPARLFRSYRDGVPDGGQLRDFVWVGDAVQVMLWLLERPDVSGLFNVGSGATRSFLDLTNSVFAALGRAPDVEIIGMPETLRATYQYRTEATLGRLREAGYCHPATPLEDGIRQYVTQFLTQPDPYR